MARSRTWLTSDRFEWDTDCGAVFMEAALAAEMAGSPSDDIVEKWLSGSPLWIGLIVCINSQRSASTTRRKRDTTLSWSRYLFNLEFSFSLTCFLSIYCCTLFALYILLLLLKSIRFRVYIRLIILLYSYYNYAIKTQLFMLSCYAFELIANCSLTIIIIIIFACFSFFLFLSTRIV